ncbi:MAG: hypothetical protein DI586_08775 [Micavibrio aeruginosavorus]|uniref:HTH cro/C1-type domain-containing protein n=1 Tax=Micavibrio aeruginosavorus TaxID=349221 RepID=A0A2W5FFP8_9BACT|nr:MAG: hypothetical protein DI586_08775 [Micavibrio aeruginosavorus]
MKKSKTATQLIEQSEIGDQIKFARVMKQLTQQDLALSLNVSIQQIARYEKGENAISYDKLQSLSSILDIPISELLTRAEPADEHPFFAKALKSSNKHVPEAEILELINLYTKINDANARQTILEMMKLVKNGTRKSK